MPGFETSKNFANIEQAVLGLSFILTKHAHG
jgi:hypothetical protein